MKYLIGKYLGSDFYSENVVSFWTLSAQGIHTSS